MEEKDETLETARGRKDGRKTARTEGHWLENGRVGVAAM